MAPAATEDKPAGGDANEPTIDVPAGIVIPPKSIQTELHKSAEFIARRGDSFEAKIQDMAKDISSIQFILADNPYNAYYQWVKAEMRAGRWQDKGGADGQGSGKQVKKGPVAPPDFHFSARLPTISAIDFDIVKLTALFVAKNGRGWMTTLSQREAGNAQFDFLRPQHSFHLFFSRLVDQYSALLTTDAVLGGKTQADRIKELEKNVQNKYHVLERAKLRAQWTKHQEAQKARKEEQEQAEKVAFAEIDWHDFVIVGTIEFDEQDDETELPPPMSLNDLQSASLEQKAAMSLAPTSRRIEEAMPDNPEFFYAQPPPQDHTPQPPMPMPPPPPQGYAPSPQNPALPYAPPPPHASRYAQEQAEEAERIAQRQAERERAEQAQAAAKGTGPMRIRNDYVPRAQARRQNANTVLCQICKQQIPSDEYENHLRIEMLDPRWREQSKIAAQRASTTNLSTADVANNLKRLASQRSDVFDPVTGQALTEEEAQRRKRAELSSYDGHSTQQTTNGGGMVPSLPPGQEGRPTNVQDQLALLQSKYGKQ